MTNNLVAQPLEDAGSETSHRRLSDRAARPMRPFFQRVAVALCSGYIIAYYAEFVFWATPDRDGLDAGGILAVWLMYSVFAYPFLCVASLFKVRAPWAVFLAGAFYGWFEEGIVVQTMYGTPSSPFPASISFTGLAWHALIGVGIGWYLLRRVLVQNNHRKTLALACAIGVFYGGWAIFWWNEPPPPMKALLDAGRKDVLFVHFAQFAFGTTVPLILAHWCYHRVGLTEFKPSKVELWVLGVLTVLYYALITVPAAPKALWVLPSLMGATFWALSKNRRGETRSDAIVAFPEKVNPLNYLLLFTIPLVATAIYFVALATDARLPTNILIYAIITPLGAVLWLLSVMMCFRPKKISKSAGNLTEQ